MSAHARHRLFKIPHGVPAAPGRWVIASHHRPIHAVNSSVSRVSEEKLGQLESASTRLAVKDNIAVRGLPTTCASKILAGQEIPFTATIVKQIERLGSVVVTSKTNMDEFGMGTHSTASAYGLVSNAPPLDGRSAGGSSGGSAVAVSIGDAHIALGTDTGGSVRMPAAYTATVGFKPSYGMLSRWGVVPYANSLDTVGLIANDVKEIETVMKHLYHEHDPNDPTSISASVRERCMQEREYYSNSPAGQSALDDPRNRLRELTFGIPIEYNIAELDHRIRDGWSNAVEKIQNLGGRVVPVSLPSTKNALSAYYVIAPAEAASNLSKYDGIRYGKRDEVSTSDVHEGVLYARTRDRGFGPEVKRRILLGSYTLSSEAMDNYFIQAQKVRQLVRKDFNRVFSLSSPLQDQESFDLSEMDDSIELENKVGPCQVDFLVCPTAPTLPPKLEDVANQTPLDAYMNDVFTVPASLAGLPAISIPMDVPHDVGKDNEYLNFGGLQLIGQYWDDARLLVIAGRMSTEVFSRRSNV